MSMADLETDPIVEALGSVTRRQENLHKALTDLDNCKSVFTEFNVKWKDLEDHFTDIGKNVSGLLEELRLKEQAFEAKSKNLQEDLAKREDAVLQKEQASCTRIQEFIDSAIASIREERRKWNEEKQVLKENGVDIVGAKSPPEDDFSTKITDVDAEPKALAAENGTAPMDLDMTAVDIGINEAPKDSTIDLKQLPEVTVSPELTSICENMDGDGIRDYIIKHKKDLQAIRAMLPSALHLASDPARLILRALEGYPLPQNNNRKTIERDAGAFGKARACITLLEILEMVLRDPLSEGSGEIPSDIKESAKEIARKWKSKMDFKADAISNSTIHAQAFLQLLSTFDIASEYDADDTCNLIVILARRKQTISLCKTLELSARVPDIIDRLCKEDRQVEALAFAKAFGLLDNLNPITLLKDYLKAARKSAQTIAKITKTPVTQHNSIMKELSALRAVLKCIEEYKLEAEYASVPLQRRVEQLEKAMSDKKRVADAVKAQAKRPKPSGLVGIQSSFIPTDRGLLNASEIWHYGGASLSPYGLSTQHAYNSMPSNMPSTSHPIHTPGRDPVSMSPYLHSNSTLGSQLYGPSAYSNPSATYSSLHFGGGMQPTPPAYQSSFPY